MNFKDTTKFLVPIAIIVAGFLIAAGLYQIGKGGFSGALSPENAAEKTLGFINNVALEGQATASLIEIVEESGLYKIRIEIEGEEYDSYVTKDAKILFPQGTMIIDSENSNPDSSASVEYPKTDIPKVELFVMSYCPFGNQAEELMIPVAELLGDKADIKLHYVIYGSDQGYSGSDYCLDEENKYCSMHGIQELNQGVREFCVQKYQKDKLWDFIKAVNTGCNYMNVDSCWEGIAKKVGISTQEIKTCEKNEALELLTQELELKQKYGVRGSPHLVINETKYQGLRSSEAYKQGICSAFNSAPDECLQVLGDEAGSVSGDCE